MVKGEGRLSLDLLTGLTPYSTDIDKILFFLQVIYANSCGTLMKNNCVTHYNGVRIETTCLYSAD